MFFIHSTRLYLEPLQGFLSREYDVALEQIFAFSTNTGKEEQEIGHASFYAPNISSLTALPPPRSLSFALSSF